MNIIIENKETISVDRDINEIMCDGGHDILGHPAVFYSFENSNNIVCGYCGRKFIRKDS